jgi:hypothetical protein
MLALSIKTPHLPIGGKDINIYPAGKARTHNFLSMNIVINNLKTKSNALAIASFYSENAVAIRITHEKLVKN